MYNKDLAWPLPLAPGRKPLSPWGFPGDRVFVIHDGLIVGANKVPPDGPLGSFRMGPA